MRATVERRYCVSEAVFLLRALIGPDFGNIYTLLADQRRGRKTNIPTIPYHLYGGIPYYLSSDLMAFVQSLRGGSRTRNKAKVGVKPVFYEIDLEKEMCL